MSLTYKDKPITAQDHRIIVQPNSSNTVKVQLFDYSYWLTAATIHGLNTDTHVSLSFLSKGKIVHQTIVQAGQPTQAYIDMYVGNYLEIMVENPNFKIIELYVFLNLIAGRRLDGIQRAIERLE